MIALLIALILTIPLLAGAYLGTKHPILAVGRGIAATASAFACAALITGLSLYPACQVWQAERAADARLKAVSAEQIEAQTMIAALGSTQAYIEYLKEKTR